MRARSLRMIDDSLPAICTLAAVAICCLIAWQVTDALAQARRVHERQESVVAALVAEATAIFAVAEHGGGPGPDPVGSLLAPRVAGLDSRVAWVGTQTRQGLGIEVTGRHDRRYFYSCDLLPGAAPAVLGGPLALRRHTALAPVVWASGTTNSLARAITAQPSTWLDPAVLGADRRAPLPAGIVVQDASIAVRRLSSGTDRRDYVLGEAGRNLLVPSSPPAGVLVIPGNLWVDRGAKPLTIDLQRSLTLVVDGNIYLGRSVVLRGPGRLFLVARQPLPSRSGSAQGFIDGNGDGAWSSTDRPVGSDGMPRAEYRGPIEGGGVVYLGLPGGRQAPAANIAFHGSLIVDGEVYLCARQASVHGAIIGGGGITAFAESKLNLCADRLPDIDRGEVPGFLRAGSLRPGLLRRVR